MGHITTRQLLAVAFFSALWGPSSAAQTCYFPDGSESGDTPCSSSDNTEVFCCPSGSTCVSNPGPLCRQSNGDYLRGSCTVQDWGSSACPKFCLAINSDNPLDRCTSGSANGNFCCGYDADKLKCNCSTNDNTFYLGQYTPIQLVATASSTTSSSSSSSTSASTTSFSSTVAAGTTDASAASAATTATGSPAPAPEPSSGLTTGAKVGLGVGIPLGLAFIGFIGLFLWRRRKQSMEPVHQPVPTSELHGQHIYPPSQHMYSPQPSQPAYGSYYTDANKDQWQPAVTPTNDGNDNLNPALNSPENHTVHELPGVQYR